jgi:hypothetical protein
LSAPVVVISERDARGLAKVPADLVARGYFPSTSSWMSGQPRWPGSTNR